MCRPFLIFSFLVYFTAFLLLLVYFIGLLYIVILPEIWTRGFESGWKFQQFVNTVTWVELCCELTFDPQTDLKPKKHLACSSPA
jgi:hypothetical protein